MALSKSTDIPFELVNRDLFRTFPIYLQDEFNEKIAHQILRHSLGSCPQVKFHGQYALNFICQHACDELEIMAQAVQLVQSKLYQEHISDFLTFILHRRKYFTTVKSRDEPRLEPTPVVTAPPPKRRSKAAPEPEEAAQPEPLAPVSTWQDKLTIPTAIPGPLAIVNDVMALARALSNSLQENLDYIGHNLTLALPTSYQPYLTVKTATFPSAWEMLKATFPDLKLCLIPELQRANNATTAVLVYNGAGFGPAGYFVLEHTPYFTPLIWPDRPSPTRSQFPITS